MAMALFYFVYVIIVAMLADTSEGAPKQGLLRLRRIFSTRAATSTADFTTQSILTSVQSSSSTPSVMATDVNVAELSSADNETVVISLSGLSEAASKPRVPMLKRKFSTPAAASATDSTTTSVLTAVQFSSLTSFLLTSDADVAQSSSWDKKIIAAVLVDTSKSTRAPGTPRLRRKLSTVAEAVTVKCSTKSCDPKEGILSSMPPGISTGVKSPEITSTMSPPALSSDMRKDIIYESIHSPMSYGDQIWVGMQQGSTEVTITDDGAFVKREIEQTYGNKLDSGTTAATTILVLETTTLINEHLPTVEVTKMNKQARSRTSMRPHPK